MAVATVCGCSTTVTEHQRRRAFRLEAEHPRPRLDQAGVW
jgi:hypothetical protein